MAAVLNVGGLAECLGSYYEGKADKEILDLYAKICREKFINYIDQWLRKNLNRVSNTNPDRALGTDPFLGLLKGMEGDKQKTKEFLLVSEFNHSLRYCRRGAYT